MRIEYYERNGRIGVNYAVDPLGPEWEQLRKGFHGKSPLERMQSTELESDLGLIPTEIQEKGRAAITQHAHEICHRHLEARIEKAEAYDRERTERRDHTNLTLHVVSPTDGVTLRGRIVNGFPSYNVVVKLEEPFTCATMPYAHPTCWAASMAGHRTFDLDTGELTPWAIEDAEQKLIQLYEYEVRRRKHGDVLDLVDGLNKSNV